MVAASLDELRRTILRYRRLVERKPYARHVIGLVLSQIAHVYGRAEARRVMAACRVERVVKRRRSARGSRAGR
ncbi:MAG: hypothetical protein Q8R91_00195 [Candidatus Omnitrophota bacterium]|nr:hypothetical protein [Candidatus Omnitrophota bacterium]